MLRALWLEKRIRRDFGWQSNLRKIFIEEKYRERWEKKKIKKKEKKKKNRTNIIIFYILVLDKVHWMKNTYENKRFGQNLKTITDDFEIFNSPPYKIFVIAYPSCNNRIEDWRDQGGFTEWIECLERGNI